MGEYTNDNIIYTNPTWLVYGLIAVAVFFAIIFNISQSWIYVCFFSITTIIVSIIEQNKRECCLSYILLGVLCSLYVVFVGLRDFGIGLDTEIYIQSYFLSASNLKSFSELRLYDGDIGFLLLAYLSTFFSDNAQSLLVSCELVFVVFSFLSICEINKGQYKISWMIFVFFFNFLYLNASMNLMRQFCAMAIMVYVLALMINSKWKRSLPFSFLAFWFHSTVIVFYPIYFLYYISRNVTLKSSIFSALMLVVIFFMITSISMMLPIFAGYGIIDEIYSERYGSDSEISGGNIFGPSFLVYYFIVLYTYFYSHKEKLIPVNIAYLAYMVHTLYFLLRLSAFSSVYLFRISQYYSYADILFLSLVLTLKRIPMYLRIIIGISVVYTWYNSYVIHNGGHTCPYTSAILGIG